MRKPAPILVAAIAIALSVTGVYLVMSRQGRLPPARPTLAAIKDFLLPTPPKAPPLEEHASKKDEKEKEAPEAASKDAAATPSTTPTARAARSRPPSAATPAPTMPAAGSAPPAATPPASADREQPAASAPATRPVPPVAGAPPARTSLFLPGNVAGWTAYDVTVDSPVLIRAAGQISVDGDLSGPNGVRNSAYELRLGRAASSTDERVLPAAPYLALVGRLCSGLTCSDPFLVGASSVLCPSELNLRGQLQLWTNNYVRVGGAQTLMRYSRALGGYSFYAEAAPTAACGESRQPDRIDAGDLPPGAVLADPDFLITSRQTSWKPFFLPLSIPLTIRATGQMQPRGGAPATGPGGIPVPTATTWTYPGTRTIVVDADHRLFDPSLPYQALIARLCGTESCGAPFLVGTERMLCPTPEFNDHVELWINHIISPRGLLGSATPLTMDAFDLQARHGEYRFEVRRAPAGACGG